MFFIAGSFTIKIKANPKDDMLAKEVFEIRMMKCYLERHLFENVNSQMPQF